GEFVEVGVVHGDAGVVIVEVGEEGQRVTERVAARAPGPASKERESAFGRFADRVLIAGDEAVERRVARNQRALISREREAYKLYSRFGAEDRSELGLIFGDRAQPVDDLVVRDVPHLQRVDERLDGLIFERVRATVPELARVEHRVEQRRRISRAA